MIPTMWFVGLAVGRWWAVPVGAVLWTLVVVIAVQLTLSDLPLVAALGAANAGVGVLLRTGVAWIARVIRRLVWPADAQLPI